MSRRPLVALATAAAAAVLALAGCSGQAQQSQSSAASEGGDGSYTIGITQITTHTSLDEAREGFKAALEEAGLNVTYDEQNAQGDQATATSIASKFASGNLDLILAIATPSAQAVAQAVADVPVLFTAVTDPVSAQLVASMDAPGANVTGTTDMNPVAKQVQLVKDINPEAKTLGIIYSSGEVNSEVQVAAVKEAAAKLGLEVKEATVTNSSEVQQAAQSLKGVDAFYVPTDNTVVSALASVIQVAEETSVPVIAGEADSVRNGAVATYGIDYEKLGRQTGEMAVRILTKGEDPAKMAVESQAEYALTVNAAAAAKMGITLPQTLLDKADEVIE